MVHFRPPESPLGGKVKTSSRQTPDVLLIKKGAHPETNWKGVPAPMTVCPLCYSLTDCLTVSNVSADGWAFTFQACEVGSCRNPVYWCSSSPSFLLRFFSVWMPRAGLKRRGLFKKFHTLLRSPAKIRDERKQGRIFIETKHFGQKEKRIKQKRNGFIGSSFSNIVRCCHQVTA